MTLKCSNCHSNICQFPLRRVLPLPSLDWQGGVQDWFCCLHGNNHDNCDKMSQKHDKCDNKNNDKKTITHHQSNSEEEFYSNKKLREKPLEPLNPEDILHSTSFILVSSKLFDEISSTFTEKEEKSTTRPCPSNANALNCKSCHSVIGELQEKQSSVRIWNHWMNFNEFKVGQQQNQGCSLAFIEGEAAANSIQ